MFDNQVLVKVASFLLLRTLPRRIAMSPQFIISMITAVVLVFAAAPALLALRETRRQHRSDASQG